MNESVENQDNLQHGKINPGFVGDEASTGVAVDQPTTKGDLNEENGEVLNNNVEPEPVKDHPKAILSLQGTLPNNQFAVVLEDIYYCYGNPKKDPFALQGVNINVPKGVIYALLGPSGCGKTTTLMALTKIIRPDSGNIRFPCFPGVPFIPGADVGYMPQELALFLDLTIEETLQLFASLHVMEPEVLKKRIESLITLFDLPYKERLVGTLSGGQKRRVSLATTLIHDPPIIILDEPTVGVDPLLRQTIWKYLVKVSNEENKTIILTTHYIDEAKDAHLIGLMRNGKVLTESSPMELMKHFDETSLEACFYKICVMGEEIADDDSLTGELKEVRRKLSVVSGIAVSMDESGLPKPKALKGSKRHSSRRKQAPKLPIHHEYPEQAEKPKQSTKDFIRKTKTLMNKNRKLLTRDWFALCMQFLLPAIEITLFGICVGTKVWDLPVAIVNDETPPRLSRQFLMQLDTVMIRQVSYSSLEDGIGSIENGECVAALYMRDNFTRCLITRMQKGLQVENSTLDCSVVKMYMDTTNQVISTNLQDSIYKSFERFQGEMLQNFGSNPTIAGLPLQFVEPIHGSVDASFSEYVTPSIIMTTPYFLALALTGITLLLEKRSGVLERFKVCGVSHTEIFIAQFLTNTVVVVVQVILMLLIQFSAFNTVQKGSYIAVVGLTILQGLCGMVLGLLLSSLVNDVNTGIIIGVGVILYPSIFLCGIIWPLEGMPRVIRYISYFVPATYSTSALRAIMSRGFGFDNPEVYLGTVSVLAWTAIFLVSAMFVFRYKK